MARKKPSLNILGLEVPVRFEAGIRNEIGEPLFGYYDPDKREIVLEPSQSPESMQRTLIHEIGHAWIDRIGIRVALSSEISEIIVEGFTNLLYDNEAFIHSFSPKKKKRTKKSK